MTFQTLVEHIQLLSLPEKEEIRSLLDRYVAEERRAEIARHHVESLEELRRDELEFSSDPARLRQMLDS